MDFAIYRAYRDAFGRDILEHAGGDRWSERNPERVTTWFNSMVDDKSPSSFNGATVAPGELRRVVRWIKFFCRSRGKWRLPGGMITTALVVECYKPHSTRDDLALLRTVEALWSPLTALQTVVSPLDGSNLTAKPKRRIEVMSLRDRLGEQPLRTIDAPGCTVARAGAVWRQFFKHGFWDAANEQPRKSLLAPVTAASTPFVFPSVPRVPSKPQGFA